LAVTQGKKNARSSALKVHARSASSPSANLFNQETCQK
jgi:hypothetical protein